MTHPPTNPPRPATSRRGIAIAVLVIVFAMISFVVIAAIGGAQGDTQASAIRVETARAFYAAESGAIIIFRSVASGETLPVTGAQIDLGSQTIEFVQTPPSGVGTVIIEGRAGLARRRINLEIQ